MTAMLRMSEEQLAEIVKRNKPRVVKRGMDEPSEIKVAMSKEQARLNKCASEARRRNAKKTRVVSEALVLRACMDVLEAHPVVALWWRQNTGAGQLASGRYVKFSFAGASDLMGVLRTGLFLAIECKATGKHASPEQRAFLDNVVEAGGKAFCVDDAKDLQSALDWLNQHRAQEWKP